MHTTSLNNPELELDKTSTELVVVGPADDKPEAMLFGACSRVPIPITSKVKGFRWAFVGHGSIVFVVAVVHQRQVSRQGFDSILDVLSETDERESTNPVDTVAGLVYLLYSQNVPTIIYDADQSEEHAWTESILALIMDAGDDGDISQVVGLSDGWGWRWILRCLYQLVQRVLVDISSPDILRPGRLDNKVDSTIEHAFDIATDRGLSIPDGVYALRSIVLPRKGLSRLLEKRKGPGEMLCSGWRTNRNKRLLNVKARGFATRTELDSGERQAKQSACWLDRLNDPSHIVGLGWRRGFNSIFDVLSEMKERKSTDPGDKVAGLAYLLYLRKDLYAGKVYRTDGDGDGYYGLCIDSSRVQGSGLAKIPSPDILRRGKLDVKVDSTIFDIVADHGFPIPDGVYAVIGAARRRSTMEGVI
ncbi:hypothetical protein EDD18DRAFT_1400099 [Armillaria luteobubalina]|uniref:Uncharacterized protein n=1 Tax=Armillaria luteobubalina TaxID=153913 RepID=A0AA39UVU5_9AGAR|nr:hypothetical protein EDD18DRAFT_1400099 [Armillaria luteobubalina]